MSDHFTVSAEDGVPSVVPASKDQPRKIQNVGGPPIRFASDDLEHLSEDELALLPSIADGESVTVTQRVWLGSTDAGQTRVTVEP